MEAFVVKTLTIPDPNIVLHAMIDPDNAVAEIKEDNNMMNKKIPDKDEGLKGPRD